MSLTLRHVNGADNPVADALPRQFSHEPGKSLSFSPPSMSALLRHPAFDPIGSQATNARMTHHVHFPKMREFVRKFIATCSLCQQSKASHLNIAYTRSPHAETRPFAYMQVDTYSGFIATALTPSSPCPTLPHESPFSSRPGRRP
jgi:hypothetical protein